METTAQKIRRRHFFINKGLQGRFVAGFSISVLLGLSANLALAYFLVDREFAEGLYKIHLKVRTTSEIAGPVLWKLAGITIPIIMLVAALVGYYLTRRIELPLQAFRQSIKRIGQGDFSERFTEHMPDTLPDVFNGMAGSLRESFGSLKASVEGLEKKYERLRGAAGAERPSKAELKNAFEELRDASWMVSRDIQRFRV